LKRRLSKEEHSKIGCAIEAPKDRQWGNEDGSNQHFQDVIQSPAGMPQAL